MIYNRIFFFTILFFFVPQLAAVTLAQTTDRSAVDNLSNGIGGEKIAEQTRYLIFSYRPGASAAEISYLYDWETGNCRFEEKTDDSEDLVVLFNTQKPGGRVFINRQPVTDENILKGVRQSFQDDSYFLFTPILIVNQEIKAVEQDPEIVDSKKFHVLKVTTPYSKYKSSKLYIDFQNGTIYKWNTYDSSNRLSQELIVSKTKDVGGGLILPTQLTDRLTGRTIDYPIVASLINIEPEKFEEP